MSNFDSLLGEGSAARQLLIYGVGYEIARSLLGPVFTQIEYLINANSPLVELAPADLADMVVRGVIGSEADAAARAAKFGIDADRFHDMTLNAGEPPGLQFLLEAFRRSYIGWDDTAPDAPSVERGIKTSRIYDYWSPVIRQMLAVPISVADAVNGLLRGQIDRQTALAEAYANGIDETRFDYLLDTAGRPPSPGELVEFVRRGLIGYKGTGPAALTFEQGIFEGDAKDKWEPLYERLTEYVPPPRTITALERAGAITAAQAQQLYQDNGLTTDMAAAYSKAASSEKLAGTKQLGENIVLTLYEGQAITEDVAATYLGHLGYGPDEVGLLLGYTDLSREVKLLNSAIGRVGTLYVAHKITRTAAADELARLGVAPAAAGQYLHGWDVEVAVNIHPLTEAQITGAYVYNVIDQATAIAKLQSIGMTAWDAWLALSVRTHGPLPGEPADEPGPGTV